MTCHPKTKHVAAASLPQAAKIPSRGVSGGFTLLEIVIVLAVSALIIGGAITTVILSSAERKLKNASSDIELLAKRARTAAILHQTPYAIQFRPGTVNVLPFAETSDLNRASAFENQAGGTESEENNRPSLHDFIEIDPDILLTIRHWNTTDFITPTENFVPTWRFDPDGLSEPLTVRLTIGDSYAQDTYHPLTATISDSELEAK
jgi:prepilin-type N-terminal cleavage/methylation domain-containing protein